MELKIFKVKDLQLGEVSKDMTNAEVLDFFKKREEMEGGDAAKILGIPEGEPIFIFCMIQGRTRPLRSFMDGGCSSWLAKNGVPEIELKSIKLNQRPLKTFVAVGHTQYADVVNFILNCPSYRNMKVNFPTLRWPFVQEYQG